MLHFETRLQYIYKAMSTRDNREQSRNGPLDALSRHIASRIAGVNKATARDCAIDAR